MTIMKRYNKESNNEGKEIIDITPDECELNIEVNNHIVCEIEGCARIFTSGGSYLFHKNKSHPSQIQSSESTDSIKKTGKSNITYRYYCPVANCRYNSPSDKYFTHRKYLKQHYGKVHGEKKYSCDSCGKKFVFERDLKRHAETCGKVFRCVTCQCPYTSPEAVLTHCKRHQHEAPISAKSSRRGLKTVEKLNQKLNTDKESPVLNPCIVIINQPKPQVSIPLNQPILPKLYPKPTYSSATVIQSTLPLFDNQSLCIGIPSPSKPIVRYSSEDKPDEHLVNSQIPSTSQCVAGIQTDIYGVDTLCSNSVDVTSTGTQANCPKNLSCTGMQTSMSFLPTRRKSCAIAGTQTLTDNILDQAMKSANINTMSRGRKNTRKSKKTSEVQTSASCHDKRSKRKMKDQVSQVSVGCGQDPILPNITFDDLASNWTQTNLSFFTQDTNFHQNIATQTQTVANNTSTDGHVDLLASHSENPQKQLLRHNLDILADAILSSTSHTDFSEGRKRRRIGDLSLGSTFSTSMDSESQTTTSASEMDMLVQYDNHTMTDIQTQTVEEELLNFLMNNMETQTTEDLFPGFGLSDIETQTLTTKDGNTLENNLQTSDITLPSNSSVSTESNVLLFDSLVTTETQTNLQSHLTLLSDMETQTTFNTIDFFTDLTDSHTQTSFF